jgi:hypothetical protein
MVERIDKTEGVSLKGLSVSWLGFGFCLGCLDYLDYLGFSFNCLGYFDY